MKRGRDSLIYDLMEPLRAMLDRRVIEFVHGTMFSKDDFTLTPQGVCRLNPQLAKRVVAVTSTDADVQASVAEFRDRQLSMIQSDLK